MTSAKAKEVSNLTIGVSYVCMLVRALLPLHAPCVLLLYARLGVSCSEMLCHVYVYDVCDTVCYLYL